MTVLIGHGGCMHYGSSAPCLAYMYIVSLCILLFSLRSIALPQHPSQNVSMDDPRKILLETPESILSILVAAWRIVVIPNVPHSR